MRCLWHEEATASLVQRKDGWYCYGVCNKLYSPKEVQERTGKDYEYEENDECAENLEEKFSYISKLPRQKIRGLALPCDERGYFVVWPKNSYYKYRLFSPGKGSKYLGPKGHKPPIFWVRKQGTTTLWIVEGEINALSLAEVVTDDVCSPGSASVFDKLVKKHLTEFKQYSNVNVIVDKDKAGMQALIAARSAFLYEIPFAKYYQLEKDLNELLCEGGPKKVCEELSRSSYR